MAMMAQRMNSNLKNVKIMKRLYMLYVAIMMLMVSCVAPEEELSPVVPDEEFVRVSVVACHNDEDDTRLMLDGNATCWEVGDSIVVAFSNATTTKYATLAIESAEDIQNGGTTATFKGDVVAGSYTRVVALYAGADSATSEELLNPRSEDNIFMSSVVNYGSSPLEVKQGSAIEVEFSHLMHKIDFKLSLASGYSSTDLSSKNIAVEMQIKSDGELVAMPQLYNYRMQSGELSSLATTTSLVADFTGHNFASTPTASVLVFPTVQTINNAELTFNVYVDGEKRYSITKPNSGVISQFNMSAGRSTVVNLVLSEENQAKADAGSSGGGSGFAPDYYIKTFKTGVSGIGSSWGIGYRAYVENSYIDIHFASSYVTLSSIEVGDYEWKGTSFMSNSERHFSVRNNAGLSAIGLNGLTTLQSGSMTVSKVGDDYYIDITLTDTNSKTVKVQYIGALNVDDGGSTGGSGDAQSSAIELTSLSTGVYNSTYGYYTYTARDDYNNAINFTIGADMASENAIQAANYEHIAKTYSGNCGYFHADSVKIGGVSKGAVSTGVLSVAKGGSDVEFSAYVTLEDGTTHHFTYSGAVGVVEKDIILTASRNSIVDNGSDYATLTVMQGSVDVSSECDFYANDEKLADNIFTATTAGSYTIYAMKGGLKSNEITVTVTEYVVKPITISASKSSLIANNVDSVQFTVMQDGKDITSNAEIYVNGVRNNGSVFIAPAAGTYRVYAKYQSVQSNTITLTATAPDPSSYEIVFAEGVSTTTGWYDVNKKAQGNNGDINMCWAAASSNMIQWFQDRYKAAGKALPAGAVDGVGVTVYENYGPYELELMNVFLSQWDNSKGGHMEQAIPWYFEGVLNGGEIASPGSQAVPKTAGGYWKSIWSSVTPYMYCDYDSTVGYTTCYNNYYLWGNGSSLLGVDRLKYFSNLVVEAFEHGMAGLTISLAANVSSAHHATTLWGYELDKTSGLVTRLWITDSDDIEREPKSQLLNEYRVSIDGDRSHIKLTGDTRYGACYVVSIHPFSGYRP